MQANEVVTMPMGHPVTRTLLFIMLEHIIDTDIPAEVLICPLDELPERIGVPDSATEAHEAHKKLAEAGVTTVLVVNTSEVLTACSHKLDECAHRHAVLDKLTGMGVFQWDQLPDVFRKNYMAKRQAEYQGQVH